MDELTATDELNANEALIATDALTATDALIAREALTANDAVPSKLPVIPLNPALLPDTTKLPVITALPIYGNVLVDKAGCWYNLPLPSIPITLVCVEVDNPNMDADPVTVRLPDILTALVLSIFNIVVLPDATVNNEVLDPTSDILNISPLLPDTEKIVEPLLLTCSAIPVEADITVLPVTLKLLKLLESEVNIAIF
jgi:hypothetical protein